MCVDYCKFLKFILDSYKKNVYVIFMLTDEKTDISYLFVFLIFDKIYELHLLITKSSQVAN